MAYLVFALITFVIGYILKNKYGWKWFPSVAVGIAVSLVLTTIIFIGCSGGF